MQPWMFDALCGILILGVTYALSSEGAWGAALMFFNVLFAGLIAFNFYEPLAVQFLAWGLAGTWADFLALMGIFLVSLVVFRVITDLTAPNMVRLPMPIYHLGRLFFGLGTALMSVAILICVLETAPVQRKLLGVVDYSNKAPFNMALDRVWLAFVQRTTGYVFSSYNEENPVDPLFDTANVFDPNASWLLDHQNGRPYPEGDDGKVPPVEAEATPPPAAPPANAGRQGPQG